MGNTKTKITFVGDQKVGKSSLISTYRNNSFSSSVPDVVSYTTSFQVDGKPISAEICDTRANDLESVRSREYVGTTIFIICFALNDPHTLDNAANKWLPEVRQVVPNAKVLLVGTKSDLRPDEDAQDVVSDTRAKTVARSINAQGFVDCSAANNEGIKSVFDVAVSIAATAGPGEDDGVKPQSQKLPKSSGAGSSSSSSKYPGGSAKQVLELLQARQVDWRSVRSLLKGPISDINFIDSDDRTTALLALCNRPEAESPQQISATKALLKAGADSNLLSPIRAAVQRGKPTLVQLLVAAKADVNAGNEEKTPLLWQLLSNDGVADDTIAETLLGAGAKVSPYKWEDFLQKAIEAKKLDLAVSVLKRGLAKPLYVGGTDEADTFVKSFVWAVSQPHCEFVEVLAASQRSRVTKSLLNDELPQAGLPALAVAALAGAHEAEAALLSLGAKPNVQFEKAVAGLPADSSLLHYHCQVGPRWIVRELIKAGADVNDNDNAERSTPLHIACKKGRKDILKELLKANAKLNVRDSVGKVPADYASNVEVAELLAYAKYSRKKVVSETTSKF